MFDCYLVVVAVSSNFCNTNNASFSPRIICIFIISSGRIIVVIDYLNNALSIIMSPDIGCISSLKIADYTSVLFKVA